MFDFLEHGFNQRALLASLVIGFSNGALGALIVLRRSALAVSALAHSLLPGIALGILIFGGLNPLVGFVGAMVGAWVAGRWVRGVDPQVLRGAVVVISVCVAIAYFMR